MNTTHQPPQGRIFLDQRDPERPVSEEQLKREYGQHIADGSIDPSEQSFADYLHNCMESQGGTLSKMPEAPKAQFRFVIRETLTKEVAVDALSYAEARVELERLYDTGEITLDRNCFAGTEFLSCCSVCHSDFMEDEDELQEVYCRTPHALILCDRCLQVMRKEINRILPSSSKSSSEQEVQAEDKLLR